MFERYSRRLESCTQLKWGCPGVIFLYNNYFLISPSTRFKYHIIEKKMFDKALPLIKFLNSGNGRRRCQSWNVPKRQPGS